MNLCLFFQCAYFPYKNELMLIFFMCLFYLSAYFPYKNELMLIFLPINDKNMYKKSIIKV